MALSIFDNLEEANDELEKIEDEIEIPHITKEEILKNYDFNFDVDTETLEFLKEHGNPDQSIVITMDGVKVMNTNRYTPANYIIKTVEVK